MALPLLLGCKKQVPGSEEVPPGITLQPGVFEDVAPRWSHDGARIAFLRHTTDRKYQLCLASADLKQVTPVLKPQYISPDRPLRNSRTSWREPEGLEWSPDDRFVVFPQVEWMTFPDGEKLPGSGLWTYDTVAHKTAPLAVHPKEYKGSLYYYRSPAWAADGKHIAFVGEGLRGETALFVVPATGRKAEIEIPRYDSFQDSGWPAWSPDGKRLAFRQGILRGYTADPVETIRIISPGGTEGGRVWATTPDRYDDLLGDDPKARTVEQSAPKVAGIAWSPDGRRIAFTVARDALDPLTFRLWTADASPPGAAPAPEAHPDQRAIGAPVWRRDGRLAAIGIRAGGSREAVMTGLGSAWITLMDLPSADFDWSPDGARIVCATRWNANPAPPRTTLIIVRPR